PPAGGAALAGHGGAATLAGTRRRTFRPSRRRAVTGAAGGPAGSGMSAITIRHDLRDRFGPARDQGGRETCLAFAMSDAHAAARGNPWAALCCEYLFYHAKQRDRTPADEGTTIHAIRAALEHDGQPAE